MECLKLPKKLYIVVTVAVILFSSYYYYYHRFKSGIIIEVSSDKQKENPNQIEEMLKNIETKLESYNPSQPNSFHESIGESIKETLGNVKKLLENQQAMISDNKKQDAENVNKETIESYEKFDKHIRTRELNSLSLDRHDLKLLPVPDISTMNDRWIVVTSIFGPTEDIRLLAGIPGWKLVVVGDTKTPKDWKLDDVVYLSVEDQLNSGFETVKYLKYGVYQRKNIGYLYAIHHGAKYIYDTDDDNHPYGNKITFDEMLTEKEYLVYHENRTHYNGFAHFGQSTLWPRGYPLDVIDKTPARTYKKCTNTRPLVQQGVVDGDPDLDAIQRLTRKDSITKFIIYFDIKAPPVVFPSKSFGPYNSQNTFHHYDAFFALLLPQTVTFRVNDIWRSFIAQRLLWDIGGHMSYYPPNAYQDRTPHNFLTDFYEEDDLYRNTNPLTQFLLKWDSKSTDMFDRHFELIKEIYKLDILGGLDVKLTRAWIRDLIRIGYKLPEMKEASIKCNSDVVKFTPQEMPTMSLRIGQRNVNMVVEGLKNEMIEERVRDSDSQKKSHTSK